MGRKERRKSEREAVKNVGRDVYNMLISKTNQEYINKEVQARFDTATDLVSEAFYKALRDNRISHERADKIINDAVKYINTKSKEKI